MTTPALAPSFFRQIGNSRCRDDAQKMGIAARAADTCRERIQAWSPKAVSRPMMIFGLFTSRPNIGPLPVPVYKQVPHSDERSQYRGHHRFQKV